MAEVRFELRPSAGVSLPAWRGGPPIDADLSCAMGFRSESVESGAKDDDLPNPSFDSS